MRADGNVDAIRRFAKRERWRSVGGIRAHEIRELYESYRRMRRCLRCLLSINDADYISIDVCVHSSRAGIIETTRIAISLLSLLLLLTLPS